jgi:hypothetical protein
MPGDLAQPRLLDLTELSLSVGPRELHEPAYSFETRPVVLHPPEAVAEAILSVSGVRLRHPAQPSWDAWKARWEEGDHSIDIRINALEVEPEECGGLSVAWECSPLRTHCRLADLLRLWESVRSRCPGVWLHDTECRLWSPKSFADEVLVFQAGTERATWRPGWGTV